MNNFNQLLVIFCKYFCLILLCNVHSVNVFEYRNLSLFREQILREKRESRLLSFQSTNDEIGIHLEFSVPFIRIPVKKAISNFHQGLPVANINLGAVVLTGAIGFGVLVVLPGILGFFQKPAAKFGYRALPENSKWSMMVNNLEEYFLLQNVNPSTCVQKAICWMVQNSAMHVTTGKAYSTDKLIDGLASNTLMQYFLNGTMFEEAIQNGYRNKNCTSTYTSCNVNGKTLNNMIKNVVTLMNSGIS